MVVHGAVTGAVACVVSQVDADIDEPNTGQKLSNVVLLRFAGNSHPVAGDSGAPVLSVAKQGAVPKCYGLYGGSFVENGKPVYWFTPFENLTW